MEEAAFQDAAPAFKLTPRKSSKRFYYLLIGIVVLILFYVIYSRVFVSSEKETQAPIPTPIVTPIATPEDTPTPEISKKPEEDLTPTVKPTKNPVDDETGLDRAKIKIEVQNGSGVVGAAGKVADSLKELGYKIASTSNADNFDYTGLTILVKSGSSDYLDLLKTDLEKSFSIESSSNDLSATVSADVLIIIGK